MTRGLAFRVAFVLLTRRTLRYEYRTRRGNMMPAGWTPTPWRVLIP